MRVLSIEQVTVVGDVGLGFGLVGTASLVCSSTIFVFCFLSFICGVGRTMALPRNVARCRVRLSISVFFICISIMLMRFLCVFSCFLSFIAVASCRCCFFSFCVVSIIAVASCRCCFFLFCVVSIEGASLHFGLGYQSVASCHCPVSSVSSLS